MSGRIREIHVCLTHFEITCWALAFFTRKRCLPTFRPLQLQYYWRPRYKHGLFIDLGHMSLAGLQTFFGTLSTRKRTSQSKELTFKSRQDDVSNAGVRSHQFGSLKIMCFPPSAVLRVTTSERATNEYAEVGVASNMVSRTSCSLTKNPGLQAHWMVVAGKAMASLLAYVRD